MSQSTVFDDVPRRLLRRTASTSMDPRYVDNDYAKARYTNAIIIYGTILCRHFVARASWP